MDRRESLKLLASVPFFSYAEARSEVDNNEIVQEADFFTDSEMVLVKTLADLIIPADDRSGSASDAGVPEFIDFMMTDRPELQVPMRGGLAWLDAFSRKQGSAAFVDLPVADQKHVLDIIAWPDDIEPGLGPGIAFFSFFRDMVASGFWSSRMGVDDLQYTGNVYIQEWLGCPQSVLDRLGVTATLD